MSGLVDGRPDVFGELLGFFGRVVGTCAVFYVFFLCRMLGAGDIKLMAVCVGILGVERGGCMIFCGMVLALLVACVRMKIWRHGVLCLRGLKMRLAPYLLAGYCVSWWMAVARRLAVVVLGG
ncbi:MAG: hypothetical protein IJ374_09670 [Lachnospiraceae bacterium]|nr:hypothetical protein [Lachnospiraceae bacterium]